MKAPSVTLRTFVLTLSTTLLLGFGFAAPTDASTFTHLGIAISVPPGIEVLDRMESTLVLGDPSWFRYVVRGEATLPTGLLIEIGRRTARELDAYDDPTLFTPAGEVEFGGIPFATFTARDTLTSDDAATPLIGRILLGQRPIAGGQYLMLIAMHAGDDPDAGTAAIDAVLSTLTADDPSLTREEIPVTEALGGLLTLRIPIGMHMSLTFDTLARFSSDDGSIDAVEVIVGEEAGGWVRASREVTLALERLGSDDRVERTTFQGEAVIAINRRNPDGFERLLIFERCLPGEMLLLISSESTRSWPTETGLPFEEFTLHFPDDAAPCPMHLLDAARAAIDVARGGIAVDAAAPAPQLNAGAPRLDVPLELTAPGDVRIALEADAGLNVTLRLIDVNGSSVIANDTSGSSSRRSVAAFGLAPGTYQIRIERQQGEGSFALDVERIAPNAVSEPEPNDRISEALAIPHDRVTSALLGYGNALGRDVEDYFAITLPDDGDLRITVDADDPLTVHVRLHDVGGGNVIANDTSGSSALRRVEARGLAAGTYYLRVTRHAGQGAYRIEPLLRTVDGVRDPEPNHAPALAILHPPLPLTDVSIGRLGYGNALGRDVEDYFAVTLPDDGDLRIIIEADADLTIHARLIDVTGSNDLHTDTSGTDSRRRVEGLGLRAGTYFLRVTRHTGQGAYRITPAFVAARAGNEVEPNDHAVMAQPLTGPSSDGRLGYGNTLGRDIEDYYAIALPDGGSIRAFVDAEATLLLHLRLYDVTGVGVLHADTSASSSSRRVERDALPPGVYYLRISRQQGYGGYTMIVETDAGGER
jgi:hypothetical protein